MWGAWHKDSQIIADTRLAGHENCSVKDAGANLFCQLTLRARWMGGYPDNTGVFNEHSTVMTLFLGNVLIVIRFEVSKGDFISKSIKQNVLNKVFFEMYIKIRENWV